MTWIGYGWFPYPLPPQGDGTAVEQPGSSPAPAAPATQAEQWTEFGYGFVPVVTREQIIQKYVVPPRHCVDCNVELDKKHVGLRCADCTLDEEALLALDGAYWDLFRLIRYGRLLNHCSEGQVYIRLIADTCRDALAYARGRLDDVA